MATIRDLLEAAKQVPIGAKVEEIVFAAMRGDGKTGLYGACAQTADQAIAVIADGMLFRIGKTKQGWTAIHDRRMSHGPSLSATVQEVVDRGTPLIDVSYDRSYGAE